MKNPIGKCGLFHTPKSMDELQAYIDRLPAGETRVMGMTIMGMTWNLAASVIDAAIAEDAKPNA